MVAYTPEHYIVYYGRSMDLGFNINVNGTVNILATSVEYSALLVNLLPDTLYFYRIRSVNSVLFTQTDFGVFTTLASGESLVFIITHGSVFMSDVLYE